MAYVIAAPELMTAAAADLAAIGSNVSAAHMVAAAWTTSLIPAAADEVSTGIAHLFSQHAASYQALAGQAAAFNKRFVQHLAAAAGSYTSAEAAIASFLQDLQNLPNVIADALAAPFPGQAALASFGSALLQSVTSNDGSSNVGPIADALLLQIFNSPAGPLLIAILSVLFLPVTVFVFASPILLLLGLAALAALGQELHLLPVPL
jgi:PE family